MKPVIKEGSFYLTNEHIVAGPAEKDICSSCGSEFIWNIPNIHGELPHFHAYNSEGESILGVNKYNILKEIDVNFDKEIIHKPTIVGYGIFDPTQGKWSQGGASRLPFKNTPKVWHQLGHLKNHLNMFVTVSYSEERINISSYYRGCEVIDLSSLKTFDHFDIYGYLYLQVDKLKKEFTKLQSFPVYEV
jgi:hypothetical protein